MKVEGKHRIENTSTPQHLIFKVTVTNGKTTKPNGNFSEFNSINTITQMEGASTPNLASDDVLSIVTGYVTAILLRERQMPKDGQNDGVD